MDHVVIGYIHPDYVRAEFMTSMLTLAQRCRVPIDAINSVRSGPNLSRARNILTRRFMEDHNARWLWMVDTDMVFAPDVLDRMVAAADRRERPILGALCYSEGDDGGDPYSTMYELVEHDKRPVFVRYKEWPDDTAVRVSGTGTGCLLVHREALDRVARVKPDPVCPWFKETVLGNALMGEDLTFCLRAGAAGVPIHVHTGIQVGHMKSHMLGKVT